MLNSFNIKICKIVNLENKNKLSKWVFFFYFQKLFSKRDFKNNI